MIKTILYLEDDDALAHITSRTLRRRGHDVIHYSSIDELQRNLSNIHFSHALLDLKIGQETSLHLIQYIKAYNDVPIVILTGYGTIRTSVQAMKLGAINFLTKPSSADDILTAFDDQNIHLESNNIILQKTSLKAVERETIQQALDDNNGNISAAARQLNIHRRTLQRKLIKRHIENTQN